jgi:putative ABC transport system substrate-binding protein
MKRRAALGALATCALAPATGRAADPVRRVGYLSGGASAEELSSRLARLGWVEGKNLRFHLRIVKSGASETELSAAVAGLVAAKPDVLVAFLDRVDLLAAATKTIPIVAGLHADPVGLGVAKSLRRPGGNVTGLSVGERESAGVWLGILKTLRPKLARLVVFHGIGGEARMRAVSKAWQDAANSIGVAVSYAPCATPADISRAFEALGDPASAAAIVPPRGSSTTALPGTLEATLYALAIQRGIAAVGVADEGALMRYETSYSDPWGRLAAIVDKVLRGESAADIPFELPDSADFVVNRATAKSIGVNLPPEILLRATDVIDK